MMHPRHSLLLCLRLQVAAQLFGVLSEHFGWYVHALPSSVPQKILVVGATGGTGQRALNGLLDVGYAPEQIQILTRNIDKPVILALSDLGFGICQADLDKNDEDGIVALEKAMAGCVGCYIHSTSSDTRKLDTGEVDRAKNLAKAILAANTIRHVVYNSAAGESGNGVDRIQQKHDVEQVFIDNKEFAQKNIGFTSLRANLFMEELWKSYTRPSILKGTYPFSVPSDRKIYLTSVRDMGRLAGSCLLSPDTTTESRIINVAGDVLTAKEIADAFGKAQGTPCTHSQSRLFAILSRLFFRDLYQVIRFYRRSTETTDIPALRQEFPGLLTSFGNFLEETRWSDPNLSFDDLKIVVPIQKSSQP